MKINDVSRHDIQSLSTSTAAMKREEKTATEIETQNRNYSAVSKDGDTLEISETGKNDKNKVTVTENTDVQNGSQMTDAALVKCSKVRLKQLFQKGKITKQQYEKAMRKQEG